MSHLGVHVRRNQGHREGTRIQQTTMKQRRPVCVDTACTPDDDVGHEGWMQWQWPGDDSV